MPSFLVGPAQTYTDLQLAVDAVAAIGSLVGLGNHDIIVDNSYVFTGTLSLASLQGAADGLITIKSAGTYTLNLDVPVAPTGYTTIRNFNAVGNVGFTGADLFKDTNSSFNNYEFFNITNPNNLLITAIRNTAIYRQNISRDGIVSGFSNGGARNGLVQMYLVERVTSAKNSNGFNSCVTVIDSVGVGNLTADFVSNTTVSYSASSDTTATGIGSIANIVAATEFVDAVNGNYTLAAGSQLLGAGSAGNNIGADQTTAAANVAPVLNTPLLDVSIATDQTVNIDFSTNFSDANTADILTYSVSPAFPAGLTLSSAGLLTNTGALAITAAANYTITANDGNGGIATDIISLVITAPILRVNSVDTITPTAGGQLIVNFANELAAITASTSAGPLTVVSQAAGTATVTVPNPPTFGNKTLNFGADVVITISDGTNTATTTVQIQVISGDLTGQIVTVDSAGAYANDVGVAIGMSVHAINISANVIFDVTTGLGVSNPVLGGSLNYAVYDGIWGTYGLLTYGSDTTIPVISLIGGNPLVWVSGTPWIDPKATVSDNVDATRQIVADSAPNIDIVGSYTLNYNATDAAGNVAVQVTRTVNVVAADVTPDQFVFTAVANAALSTLYEDIQSIINMDAGQTVTATGGLVSNDNGVTWASSVQMITGQTLVKASVTTGAANSTLASVAVTVNGIVATFSVTTKALVTLAFSIGSSDPIVDSAGANFSYTYPIWELWDKIPEDPTAVVVDSGVNMVIANGVGSINASNAVINTTYHLIARDAGNTPLNYVRTTGQVA